jgi:uncharacterized membrane protein
VLKRQFTELDFFSYTGGALGLFLGFSILSFIEIIYYFTIRICFEKLRQRKVHPADTVKESPSNYIVNYFNSSSIHGMNQVVFKHRHSIEKLIWLTLLVIALIYSGIVAVGIYDNYQNASIIMTYEDKLVKTEDV